MTELLTAAQMRAIEAEAIASGRVTGLELMQRAGQGVVDAVLAEWPDLAKGHHRAVVLCGPGNNGGDGFVVARLLKDRGWEVEVFLYGDPAKIPPDARTNYDQWCGQGDVTRRAVSPPPLLDDSLYLPNTDILLDCLFGTGLSRPFTGVFAHLGHAGVQIALNNSGVRRIAVDVPSGLCADSGRILGSALPADLTVTFHRSKQGHYLADGPGTCSKLVVADIGL